MRLDHHNKNGFTLVEMIMVIVLLGILAGVLTPMIITSINAQQDVQARGELISKGRLALERLARELRQAAPNSVRIVGGGTGVEFISARFGGRVITQDDVFAGGEFSTPTRRFSTGTLLTELYTAEAGYAPTAGEILFIGNTNPADLDAGSTVTTLTGSLATTIANDTTTDGLILTFAANSFPFDSPGKHFFIIDNQHEIGLVGDTLRWHRVAAMGDYNNAVDYSVTDPVLVDGVSAINFGYDPGASQASGVLRIDLQLTDTSSPDEVIRLYHEVHIRNTP